MKDIVHPTGTVIHLSGERLCLTDMWKAAGSPENREPWNWSRFEGSRFIDAVAQLHNLSTAQVIEAKKGKGGGTWAHWQIGIAYAQYVSTDFHMWANTVVRERMEGKAAAPAFDPQVLGGIIKAVVGKQIKDALTELAPQIIAARLSADPRIAAVDAVPALQVAIDAKVPKAGRRPIVQEISRKLARYSEENGQVVRRDVRGTKLFTVHAVSQWRLTGGDALIRKLVAANTSAGPLFAVLDGGKSA